MIISIAISFKTGALWTCAEDFETAEEGFLYAQERGIKRYGRIQTSVVAPLRATGLVMAREIRELIEQAHLEQVVGIRQ